MDKDLTYGDAPYYTAELHFDANTLTAVGRIGT